MAAKLAWSNTTDNWQRLFVRCSGVTFAVILIFLQTGFRNALFDSNVRIMEEKVTADIVVRNVSRTVMSSGQQLPIRFLTMARSCEGVHSAEPLYIESIASGIRRFGFFSRRIRVIAFDPLSDTFANFELHDVASRLSEPGTAAADVKSKSMYHLPQKKDELSNAPLGELNGKQIRIVGLFKCGIDFSNDGNLVMTPENFAEYFPHRGRNHPLSMVDYGVIRCTDASDVENVVQRLRILLGSNVIVQSRSAFLLSERNFWGNNTPIGLIFWVGTMISFVVGLIICYQVLATDIGDHLGEFATLKAMGYPPAFFAAVVVTQALLLSLVSFVPGLVVALITFEGVNVATGLVMFLNLQRTTMVLGLTVLMCVISGFIALRKLLSADPASLF